MVIWNLTFLISLSMKNHFSQPVILYSWSTAASKLCKISWSLSRIYPVIPTSCVSLKYNTNYPPSHISTSHQQNPRKKERFLFFILEGMCLLVCFKTPDNQSSACYFIGNKVGYKNESRISFLKMRKIPMGFGNKFLQFFKENNRK